MNTNELMAAVSILVVLSGSAERLVEILKGFIPALNKTSTDPVAEARRKAMVQVLSVACCVVTAFIARDLISHGLGNEGYSSNQLPTILGMGVLSAGGSSLWNSVLTYLVGVKDIKKAEATARKSEVQESPYSTFSSMLPAAMPPPQSTTS